MARLKSLFLIAVVVLLPSVSLAEGAAPSTDCKLYQVDSLDMNIEPEGLVTVPLSVDGQNGLGLIDTGNITSEVTDDTAFATKAPVFRALATVQMMGGFVSSQYIIPKTISIGKIQAQSFVTYLLPGYFVSSNQIGIIGPNILANYDIDFDYAHGKLGIFSQDHCPGRVVYWTHDGHAEIPFKFDLEGHILINVVLNGKTVTALVDTGAQNSALTADAAEDLLGVKLGDPNMKATGDLSINSAKATQTYRYPFSSLTFGPVTVTNPDILIVKDDGMRHSPDQLLLGASVLRQLHMYVAYKEGKLYLTGAEATPIAEAPPAPPTPAAATKLPLP